MMAEAERIKAKSVLEFGPGYSTFAWIEAGCDPIVCLEHDKGWSERLIANARSAGVKNIGMCYAPLAKDGWYDLAEFELPDEFAFGFCDGPPRAYGTRTRFMDELAPRCGKIAVDDAHTPEYSIKWLEWAKANNRVMNLSGRLAVLGPPVSNVVKIKGAA